ncbi:MAG: hypothetical protein IT355_02210 [Gemmatimonadaceae bacterium]|nr:hypothetical protein [Gemmatimonadaceae bacterium]
MIVLVAGACLSAPAEAQFGGLRRAVERRVEQKVDDKANVAMLVDPVFDATTVEITGERLDRYVAAMQRAKTQREGNRRRYEQLQEQSRALADSARLFTNEREESAYRSATSRWDECARDARKAAEDASEKRMQELMMRFQSNPAAMQNDPKVKEIVAAMQEMGAAQQRGDQAAAQRATERAMNLMGSSADTTVLNRGIRTKCGATPAKPASMVRAEAYNARSQAVQKESEGLLASTSPSGADVGGGMTNAQSRMMWERIASWLAGMRQDAAITRTFTRAEYDLLTSRRSDLRRAFSGSE